MLYGLVSGKKLTGYKLTEKTISSDKSSAAVCGARPVNAPVYVFFVDDGTQEARSKIEINYRRLKI